MPNFQITIINEEFSSSNEHKCLDQEAARRHAIQSALAIGAEQVAAGRPFFAAHVSIREEGRALMHLVVSLGAAPLTMVEPVGE